MKRLAFCFDGTWNRIDSENPTNVARIAQSISRFDAQGHPQIIYYDEGVGTSATERWSGGIFGHGMREKIIRAYHELVLNYEPGDEIYVFGFSRGAFTARSFIGLLRNCGIMSRRSLHHIRAAVALYMSRTKDDHPNSEEARLFRFRHCPTICLPGDRAWRQSVDPELDVSTMIELRVAYLGVWDTVGALGIPKHLKLLAWLSGHHQFHDTNLSSFVLKARHGMAADERRRSFEPGIWTNLDDLNDPYPDRQPYEQLIFPGVHSAVGGGGPVRGLSDAALEWVFEGASEQGLEFDTDAQSPIFQLRPDHRAQLFNETGKTKWSFKDWAMGLGLKDREFPKFDRRAIHPSLVRRFGELPDRLPEKKPYRPPSLKRLWGALGEMVQQAAQEVQLKEQAIGTEDPRILKAPSRIKKYTVQPGDTLTSIAREQMASEQDVRILAMHNRTVGLLFEDDELYAGSTLEIPVYADEATAPEPVVTPAAEITDDRSGEPK